MESKTYQAISEFDEQKDYGFSTRPRHKKCLTLLQNNPTLTPKDFLSKHLDDIGKKETPLKQKNDIFYQAMSIGKKIGVISDYSQHPIQFRDFTGLETVHYFTEQLRQDKRKNTKWDIHNLSPTQKSYLYALWNFSNWLHAKESESDALIRTDLNEYKKINFKIYSNYS